MPSEPLKSSEARHTERNGYCFNWKYLYRKPEIETSMEEKTVVVRKRSLKVGLCPKTMHFFALREYQDSDAGNRNVNFRIDWFVTKKSLDQEHDLRNDFRSRRGNYLGSHWQNVKNNNNCIGKDIWQKHFEKNMYKILVMAVFRKTITFLWVQSPNCFH